VDATGFSLEVMGKTVVFFAALRLRMMRMRQNVQRQHTATPTTVCNAVSVNSIHLEQVSRARKEPLFFNSRWIEWGSSDRMLPPKKQKERKESDAPTQTIIAMRAPLAKVVAVDDDDDEPVVVLA
jgi:hypothetical protein